MMHCNNKNSFKFLGIIPLKIFKGLKVQLSLNKNKIELTIRYPKYKDTKQKKPLRIKTHTIP